MQKNRRVFKVLAVVLTIAVVSFMLAGCGDKDKEKKKQETTPEPETKTTDVLKVKNSGWDYSKKDGKIYYSIILENQSDESRCTAPEVEATAYGSNNKEIAKEEMVLPGVDPGKTVAYGMAGKRLGMEPKKVEFKIKETDNWVINSELSDGNNLVVKKTGVRSYSGSSASSNEMAELKKTEKDLKKLDKELGGSTAGSSASDSSSDADAVEYYGTLVNNNDYSCKEVLVSVLFVDSNGKLKGGENVTVRDVSSHGKKSVSIVSFSDANVSKCKMYAYEW